jgi:AraC-like DNA-binding protein
VARRSTGRTPRHTPALPSASGGIARLAYTRAKEAGLAVDLLVRKAGLRLREMDDPSRQLRVRDQIEFLNLAAAALQDEFLGFHLAHVPDLREIGLLYYVLASSDVLGDAFERVARYSTIINEGVAAKALTGREFGLSLHYVGVSRHADRHQIEFWLAALVMVCRQLTGLRLLPKQVRVAHQRERHSANFAELFGDDVQFGAEVDEIVFDANAKDLPVVSADPYLNKLLISYCEAALADRPRNGGSFRSIVENSVVPLLPHGKARLSEIAPRIGVSQRTLARRLAAERLSFSSLLVQLRRDLATRYLSDPALSISQIAWMLGYREVGGFSHAFKSWTGKTPREARGSAVSHA